MRTHASHGWTVYGWLVVGCSGVLALGCGADDQASDLSRSGSAIIGGTTIDVATQYNQGLLTVEPFESAVSGFCTASTIQKDWVLTATHCIVDFTTPNNNVFQINTNPAGYVRRHAVVLSQLGTSDITLVQLGSMFDDPSDWPQITRTMYAGSPSGLVGKSVTCYGRGDTQYNSPSGTTNSDIWKTLTKVVAGVDWPTNALILNADSSGSQTGAPGDSGAPCYYGSQTVGVVHGGNEACTDPTNETTCNATITHIYNTLVPATNQFADYINNAPTKTLASFQPLTLASGWTNGPWSTTTAAVSNISNIVHFRGAVATSGSSTNPFKLPTGFQPPSNVYVPITLCSGAAGRLDISSDGTTYVEGENGDSSDYECMTSLDGASFALSSSGWTTLTPASGWSNAPYGTRNIAATNIGGVVHLQGALSGGTSGTLFTLPSALRPDKDVYVVVDLCNAAKGRLDISASTGVVSVQTTGAFSSASCFTSLEGASFARTSSGYTALTLTPGAGWTNAPFSTHSAGAANVGGIVHLIGAIATTGTSTQPFVLPTQFRPATAINVPIDLCLVNRGTLVIGADGTTSVTLGPGATWSDAQCFTSLDGVSFGI
jgi:hypothetical protein